MSACRRIPAAMRSPGFSMIELMVVVSIAMILLSIGIPSFSYLIQQQKISTTVNDFFAAIHLTRSEAMQRGTRVDLVAADATDWAKGWIIFIDRNSNQKPDSGEQIILSHGPVPSGIAITSALTDSQVKYIAYQASGRTRTNASNHSPQLGTISFTIGEQARRIKINFLGRPRVCNPAIEKTSC